MPRPRKLRRDAGIKKLTGAARRQVLDWLERDGEESARRRIFSELHICSPKDPAQPIAASTLYDAVNYWQTQAITDEMFSFRDAQAELMQGFRPGDAKLAREFGEFALLQRANKSQDKDLFAAAAGAQDSRRRLDLEEASGKTKARQKDAQIKQKDRDLALAERRVAVLEKKFADAQQTLSDPSLSMPEREARMKEMFGIGA